MISYTVSQRSLTTATSAAKKQGDPAYDVLLQPPDQACATVAAATTSIVNNVDRRRNGKNERRDPCTDAAAAAADADAGRELTALPASDLSPLQPFELDESIADGNDNTAGSGRCQAAKGVEVSLSAETLKDRGNALFKLGDTDAAAEWFCRVLRTLEQTPVVGRWWEERGRSVVAVAGGGVGGVILTSC